jgi:hypothetical protein
MSEFRGRLPALRAEYEMHPESVRAIESTVSHNITNPRGNERKPACETKT